MKILPKILKEKGEKILCFSITITGKCNANCSYCHFFARKERREIACDISKELLESYLLLIKNISNVLSKFPQIKLYYRFSGGEPLMLNRKLFEFAQKAYEITNIKPYVLTNGKAINKKFIETAQKYKSINHLYVSVENPFDPDPGAPDVLKIIKKIKKFNSEKFPIIPGVVVIKNQHFKNLFKIANFFYKNLNCLPAFSEEGYALFTPPTELQLRELHENIVKIITNFSDKTKIILFPSITSISSLFPEFCGEHKNIYILGLDLENKYKINKQNIKQKTFEILQQFEENYPIFNCDDKNCKWSNGCKRILKGWLYGWKKFPSKKSIKSYCELKKTIYEAILKANIILKYGK